jgi:hypothetical protein
MSLRIAGLNFEPAKLDPFALVDPERECFASVSDGRIGLCTHEEHPKLRLEEPVHGQAEDSHFVAFAPDGVLRHRPFAAHKNKSSKFFRFVSKMTPLAHHFRPAQ